MNDNNENDALQEHERAAICRELYDFLLTRGLDKDRDKVIREVRRRLCNLHLFPTTRTQAYFLREACLRWQPGDPWPPTVPADYVAPAVICEEGGMRIIRKGPAPTPKAAAAAPAPAKAPEPLPRPESAQKAAMAAPAPEPVPKPEAAPTPQPSPAPPQESVTTDQQKNRSLHHHALTKQALLVDWEAVAGGGGRYSASVGNELLRLWLALMAHAGRGEWTCWPGQDELARYTRLHRITAGERMRTLRDAGLISWKRRPGTSNLISLHPAVLYDLPVHCSATVQAPKADKEEEAA